MNPRVPYHRVVIAAAAALLIGGAAVAQQAPPPPQQPRPAPRPQTAPAPAPATQGNAMQLIDSARQLYQSGRLLDSAEQLNAAMDAIYGQLNQRYGSTLPAAPQGWQIEQPDPQRAALMGSAAAGVRDYRPVGAPPPGAPPSSAPGQQSMPPHMNARIVLDSDAVKAMQPLFGAQLPQGIAPTVKRMKIGEQDAVVAYDPQRRAGEVSVLVGNKILLQVEGVGVSSADPMIATMRNWNVAELRRLAGI